MKTRTMTAKLSRDRGVKSATDAVWRQRHTWMEYRRVAQARQTARVTEELLDAQGWCLWSCESLGGDVVAIVRDQEAPGVPDRYVTYSEAELLSLFGRSEPRNDEELRLIHEAKRSGARVCLV